MVAPSSLLSAASLASLQWASRDTNSIGLPSGNDINSICPGDAVVKQIHVSATINYMSGFQLVCSNGAVLAQVGASSYQYTSRPQPSVFGLQISADKLGNVSVIRSISYYGDPDIRVDASNPQDQAKKLDPDAPPNSKYLLGPLGNPGKEIRDFGDICPLKGFKAFVSDKIHRLTPIFACPGEDPIFVNNLVGYMFGAAKTFTCSKGAYVAQFKVKYSPVQIFSIEAICSDFKSSGELGVSPAQTAVANLPEGAKAPKLQKRDVILPKLDINLSEKIDPIPSKPSGEPIKALTAILDYKTQRLIGLGIGAEVAGRTDGQRIELSDKFKHCPIFGFQILVGDSSVNSIGLIHYCEKPVGIINQLQRQQHQQQSQIAYDKEQQSQKDSAAVAPLSASAGEKQEMTPEQTTEYEQQIQQPQKQVELQPAQSQQLPQTQLQEQEMMQPPQ